MNSFVRSFLFSALLTAGPLAALPVAAQGQLRPLLVDPTRAARSVAYRQAAMGRRTAALALPVFDDFADDRFGSRPDPALWDTTGGVLRNETFARQPPSYGVVTFDGLNGAGRSYSTNPTTAATDTLTSRPIDLAGRTDVVLSFWWQAGGASGDAFAPSSLGTLTLDFDDGSGIWDLDKWHRNGPGTTTDFQQVFVRVPDLYCTGNFRFRFRTRGSPRGSIDLWSVDYVVLDANRQPQPGPVTDVAFSQPLTSPLKRFTAMPVWQFNAAATPAEELADSVRTTLNNLEPDPNATSTPLDVKGYLTARGTDVGGAGPVESQFLSETRVVAANARQLLLRAAFRPGLPAPLVSPEFKTFITTLLLVSGELNQRTRYNDTIRRAATLNTYYAADDGSAELVYSVRNTADPAAAAIGFDLNTPDQVRGVALYLGGDIPAATRLFVDVWADDPQQPGRPASTPLAHVGFTVPADSVLRRTGRWHTVFFAPVAVSGRFYAGYSQPANTVISSIGFDISDSLATTGRFFFRARTNPWLAETFGGALMVRAHLNQNGVLGLPAPTTASVALAVFPNPVSATGAAELYLPAERGTVGTLYDAVGRPIRTAAADAATLSVRGLTPGVYILRLTAPSAPVRSVRVLVTK
ncbi:MAG: T9SS type A sorting domain-containing protein [Hymenobacteraceae bacterium]|nr:T9SS type A sorting domain-containing protein [Hymenobacteraceae bacterium]